MSALLLLLPPPVTPFSTRFPRQPHVKFCIWISTNLSTCPFTPSALRQVPEAPPSMINIKMTTELETDSDHDLHWDQKTLESGLHTADSASAV